uniref:DUF3741 domain-containing protein n=1 Tax=Aegilops tauschii subsp. strangulata TaxID=200361 RepID=A0A453SVV4_AEGTS
MVAMGADEEERPVHQGCMAGFLHLFDRPHVLSGKRRLCHHPRRLLSSSSSGSATPSEMSMPLDRATPLPSSPEMTPPAAPRPSLQLPPLDLKDRGGAAASWRLPRLSLDSRAVVDARGKLRQRDNIRTAAPPSPGVAGSPSVVARLMGLDALPHGAADEEDGQHAARGGELRRSASERVPRDPARFRFVDPSFFEKPALLPQRPSSPTAEAALAQRQSPDPAFHRAAALQRRSSHFDAREVFPEPARSASTRAPGAARSRSAARSTGASASVASPSRPEISRRSSKSWKPSSSKASSATARHRRHCPCATIRLPSSSCARPPGRRSLQLRPRGDYVSKSTMPAARVLLTGRRPPHGARPPRRDAARSPLSASSLRTSATSPSRNRATLISQASAPALPNGPRPAGALRQAAEQHRGVHRRRRRGRRPAAEPGVGARRGDVPRRRGLAVVVGVEAGDGPESPEPPAGILSVLSRGRRRGGPRSVAGWTGGQ